MNIGFYKDLDTNFEHALEMAEKDFSQKELLDMLKNGNIPEKQIAALKLNVLNNKEDAEILISNLTGCDGKIREAVALKINQLLNQNVDFVKYFTQAEVFAQASIDINPNICRLALDSVEILNSNQEFATKYLSKILEFINETFIELDKFIFRDKKYVINKQLFKLFWCLEALKFYTNTISANTLFEIIDKASKEREYTIREKAAQIVVNIQNPEFDSIKERLKNDENYYVKNVFKMSKSS